jgi:hypothetical protein
MHRLDEGIVSNHTHALDDLFQLSALNPAHTLQRTSEQTRAAWDEAGVLPPAASAARSQGPRQTRNAKPRYEGL